MKRLVALLLALVMCLPLCACGGSSDAKNTPSSTFSSSGKFELNDKGRIIWPDNFLEDRSNVEMLEERLKGSSILGEMNVFAARRAESYTGVNKWKTFDSFTSYEVTSMELTEGNTIVEICGNLFGKTQSGKAVTTTFSVDAYFKESEKWASGYYVGLTSWAMGELN